MAGVPQRPSRRGAALRPACRADRLGEACAADHTVRRRRAVADLAGQQADLLHHRGHARQGRKAPHGEKVQRRDPEHGASVIQPLGPRPRQQEADTPHARHHDLRDQFRDLQRRQVGRLSRLIGKSVPQVHQRGVRLRRRLPPRDRDGQHRTAHAQRRDRRKQRELLARQPLARVLGVGRHDTLQLQEPSRVSAPRRRPGRPVAQTRQRVRRRHVGRFLVSRREDHLLHHRRARNR